jgi:hypothetical protein
VCRKALLVLLCLAAGCAGPPAAGPDLAFSPGPDMADCRDAGGERARGGSCVRTVRGRALDDRGAPVPDMTVTVCAGLCFFGKTGADGRFTVAVDSYIQVGNYGLLLHAQPRHAAYYQPLPAPAMQIEIAEPLPLLPLPQEGPALKLDPSAQTLTAAGVTLSIEAGTQIFLSPEDAGAGEVGLRFRPLRVTALDKVPFLRGPPPLALYAFGPFEVIFKERPVRISFPNTTGLPANTALELHAQRGLLDARPLPPWVLEKVAEARVSADGQRIDMAPGAGLTRLTWIAIYRKD